eukprot:g11449.t1
MRICPLFEVILKGFGVSRGKASRHFSSVRLCVSLSVIGKVIICICDGKEDWMRACGDVQTKLFQRAFFLATPTGKAFFYFYVGSMTILMLPEGIWSVIYIILGSCLSLLALVMLFFQYCGGYCGSGYAGTTIAASRLRVWHGPTHEFQVVRWKAIGRNLAGCYHLDDLGKRSKRERYVEVKRPDGTIAKARGERTFYGAFEGGFSAGYWNTVGSKEGWEPASFSSSRSKRHADAAPRVEDYMDEEDLRDHRSSRKTITARDEFAARNDSAGGKAGSAALTTGVSHDLEEELFGANRLGTRLLRASVVPVPSQKDVPNSAASDTAPKKKSYGCAPPPPGYRAGETAEGSLGFKVEEQGKRLADFHSSQAPSMEPALEAELERLWHCKNDLQGIGYFLGAGLGSAIPSNRRLYMSNARGRNMASTTKAIGYSQFGTGVLDQDEYDAWEEVYEHETDKRMHYHAALKDESEHRKLLEFQDKHGRQRLMDPSFRAQLLGEQTRIPPDAAAPAAPAAAPVDAATAAQRSAEPLWQAVPEHQKQNLLNALGRNFVVGATQDMDGKAARHEPFKSDPSKQKRYAKFCLAMEGKAAFSEALQAEPSLSEAQRESEVVEFGREGYDDWFAAPPRSHHSSVQQLPFIQGQLQRAAASVRKKSFNSPCSKDELQLCITLETPEQAARLRRQVAGMRSGMGGMQELLLEQFIEKDYGDDLLLLTATEPGGRLVGLIFWRYLRSTDDEFWHHQCGIAIGRLCEKCDGKCVICDSYVRPSQLARVCDECNYGSYQGRCECCQCEKDRDGCPKIVNLGTARTDLFYERKKYGFKSRRGNAPDAGAGRLALRTPPDSWVLIELLCTEDAFRGRGVAALSYSAVKANKTAAVLTLGRGDANRPAAQLYRKLGFQAMPGELFEPEETTRLKLSWSAQSAKPLHLQALAAKSWPSEGREPSKPQSNEVPEGLRRRSAGGQEREVEVQTSPPREAASPGRTRSPSRLQPPSPQVSREPLAVGEEEAQDAPVRYQASLVREGSDVAWGFAWNVGGPCVSGCKLALLAACDQPGARYALPPGRSGFEFIAKLLELEKYSGSHPAFNMHYGGPIAEPYGCDEVVGKISKEHYFEVTEEFSPMQPYRSLIASRLKLSGTGAWDLQKHLDSILWLPFQDPGILLHSYDIGNAGPSFKFEKIEENLELETLRILQRGGYSSPEEEWVDLNQDIEDAVQGSFVLHEGDPIRSSSPERASAPSRWSLEVTAETSLEALYRLAGEATQDAETSMVLLNFASAKNPGGGFLGGAQAQEESLARSSALFPCLDQFKDDLYAANRKDPRNGFYSDDMIFSPKVPFFRTDTGALLPRPVKCSVITAPAVNAGVVGGGSAQKVLKAMEVRLHRLLRLALAQNSSTLILGAWGCGVFRNDPKDVASLFDVALARPELSNFGKVVFAVPDPQMKEQFSQVLLSGRRRAAPSAAPPAAPVPVGPLPAEPPAVAEATVTSVVEDRLLEDASPEWAMEETTTTLPVRLVSFGYGRGGGIPAADLVFDARCIQNPQKGPLRHLSGLDARLRKEVMANDGAEELFHEILEQTMSRISREQPTTVASTPEGRRLKISIEHREEASWSKKGRWRGRQGRDSKFQRLQADDVDE